MGSDNYLNELRSAVGGLIEEAGLREASSTESPHYLAVRYANATTGVEFAVEWQELRPLVTLFELVDGVFIERDDPIQASGHRRVSFDADDLLNLRKPEPSPVGRMFRRKAPGEVSRVMSRYAEALRANAQDVLGGDFSVFEQLDEQVRRRAEALENESWRG